MNGLLDYQCQVYESGYEITPGELQEPNSDGDVFMFFYVRPIDSQSTRRVFNLMEHTGAYYEFAHSVIDLMSFEKGKLTLHVRSDMDNRIIKYANKYGLLEGVVQRENTVMWLENMMNMAIAVVSLERIKTGNVEGLRQFFTKEGDLFKVIEGETLFGLGLDYIRTIGQTPPRNFSEAAYHYIGHIVNQNINDSLITETIVNPTNTGTDMIVRPKNLLSGLWLQLAHAVSRNLEFKRCAACSSFFEVRTKKRRFEKIYCSDRCRVRVSATARRLREKEKAK